MSLEKAAQRIAVEFEIASENVNKAVEEFIREMDEGLQKDGTSLSQIPTYVTAVPKGNEKGLYMAVDLGGTNFRVCSILLHGDSTFSLTQSKVAIPQELMLAKTSKELFSFLAKQIEAFLKQHHSDHYHSYIRRRKTASLEQGYRDEEIFNLGLTFSFPVNQVGINRGTLIRWTKGFDIHETVGKDVCMLLQSEVDELHLPVKVAALVNDTVGTLMARSYTSPGKNGTFIGGIFGTGTNGAYVEKLDKITKLKGKEGFDTSTGEMIVNTEWGSFDNDLNVLPTTSYDADLDKESVNPGIQMFEKRVSGMFLGEIFRRAILSLIKDPQTKLFAAAAATDSNSPFYKTWGVDTSFLSIARGDDSNDLHVIREALKTQYNITSATAEDATAVKIIAAAIGRRAARLASVPLCAIILSTGKLDELATKPDDDDNVIDIGLDGSLIEFYPGFEKDMREAMLEG